MKVLKHNGEIVSSYSFGEDRISCMLLLILENNKYVLKAENKFAIPIKTQEMTEAKREIPVNIENDSIISHKKNI